MAASHTPPCPKATQTSSAFPFAFAKESEICELFLPCLGVPERSTFFRINNDSLIRFGLSVPRDFFCVVSNGTIDSSRE
jgi:hypothetical protein